MSRGAESVLLVAVPVALVGYAVWAVVAGWWVSGAAALGVAVLLVRRHPRARFAAYVLLSVVAVRAGLTAAWPALVLAGGVIAVLQAPAATRLWPRLAPGARPWSSRPR